MKYFIAALIVITLAGCQSSTPSLEISDIDWRLWIDQPIRQLEAELEKVSVSGGQQSMNYTSASVTFLHEIKLYLVFQSYMESLPVDERSGAILEQKRWMEAHRKKTSEVYDSYGGGSGAGYASAEVSIAGLKERIENIQALTTH